MITNTTTQRGFSLGSFEDTLGNPCSIQRSSLATKNCIWLGRDGNVASVVSDADGNPVELEFNMNIRESCVPGEGPSHHSIDTRMHLSRPMVGVLVSLMEVFLVSN